MKNKPSKGRDLFNKYKPLLIGLYKFYSLFPINKRKKMFYLHRNNKGKLGIAIRYSLLKSIAEDCGDNVAIFEGVYLLNPEKLRIGNNVSIHPMCYIECKGGINIGDDVSIAHGVTIMSTTHTYSDRNEAIKNQKSSIGKVTICSNVWVGAKATILCNITIQQGCIIGANALLNKSTEPFGIYAGIPARMIKER